MLVRYHRAILFVSFLVCMASSAIVFRSYRINQRSEKIIAESENLIDDAKQLTRGQQRTIARLALNDHPFQNYVLIPYTRTIDEILFRDMVKGRFTLTVLPKHIRVQDGKVQTKVTDWVDLQDYNLPYEFAYQVMGEEFVFPNNSKDSYFIAEDVYYSLFHDRLPMNHQGRIEYFYSELPDVKNGVLEINDDLLNVNKAKPYIWDATDGRWRNAHSLRLIDFTKDQFAAERVKDTKPTGQTGPLDKLVKEHAERAAKQKK